MSLSQDPVRCPDCESQVDRRDFLRSSMATAATVGSVLATERLTAAPPTKNSAAETAVRRLYDSLTDAQRKVMALKLKDPRRKRISANWEVTKAIVNTFSADQQATIQEIVKGITSPEGFERFLKQMDDDSGGLETYSIAIFGNPHKNRFEFELTGRHVTMRADGNTMKGLAFGGPIVYGHGEEEIRKNLFFYQTQQANEVFQMLDGKQREQALLKKSPNETAVQLRQPGQSIPGIAGSELSSDQRELLSKSLATLLAPYRQEDIDEVMAIVAASGGVEKLHMAFYQDADLDDDKVWDNWRIEGPSLVCHFRGAPHVHAYINVAGTV